jgi:hypothetical protein
MGTFLIVGNVPITIGDRVKDLLRDILEGLGFLLPHVASQVTRERLLEAMESGLVSIGAGSGCLIVKLDEGIDCGFGCVNFSAQEVKGSLGRRGKTSLYTFLIVGESERRTILAGASVGVVRGAAGKGMAGEFVRRACHRGITQRLECFIALVPTVVRTAGLEELAFVVMAAGDSFAPLNVSAVRALQKRLGVTPGGVPETVAFNGVFVELFGQLSDIYGRPLGLMNGVTSVGSLSSQAFLIANVSSTVTIDELLSALEFGSKDGLTLAMVDWVLLLLNPAEWVVVLLPAAAPLREQYQLIIGRDLRPGDAGATATLICSQPRWRARQFPPLGTPSTRLGTNPNSFSFSAPVGTQRGTPQFTGKPKFSNGRASAGRSDPPPRNVSPLKASFSQVLVGGSENRGVLVTGGASNSALDACLNAIEKLTIPQQKTDAVQARTLQCLDRLMEGEERQAEAIARMDRFIQGNLPRARDV